MADYKPIKLRAFYRSPSHLHIWEILDKAEIWQQVGVESVKLEYCLQPAEAEAALFDGSIDFVSGNHITPYGLVARGKPIVCLASPSNNVRDRLVSKKPIGSLPEVKGLKIADLSLEGRVSGFNHLRGNHMLYLIRAGVGLDEVQWIDLGEDMSPEFRAAQYEAMTSGEADATFVTGGTEQYEQKGFHVLELGALPMITGPTLTTSYTSLRQKDRLGERLVKAFILGVHYAQTHREESEKILEGLRKREPEAKYVKYASLERMPKKPYPQPQAVINAYELCCMKDPKAKELSPMALWDTHYLRELDDSGFIDGLYQ